MKKNFLLKQSLVGLPTPSSVSFLWNMGFLLGMTLSLQLISGVFLSMNYLSSLEEAFNSVLHIMRDVQAGWVLRYLHLNGASLFFVLLYLHVWRGMFFNSPKKIPLVWISGVFILLLAMMTAFMGYVLPWGQMSYWGATVITSMLSSFPYIGGLLIMWLWGDYSVSQPMLNRMLSLHFLMPMVLVVLVLTHLLFLHSSGSSNPLGVETNFDKLKFLPYFMLKDVVPMMGLMLGFSILICLFPLTLGDPENFNPASIYTTPTHIKPEWYFLFAYAILRCIPSKLGGVLAMLFSILIVLVLVLKNKSTSGKFSVLKKFMVFMFIFLGVLLTWMGGKPVNDVTITSAQLLTVGYFSIILLICLFSLNLKNKTFSKFKKIKDINVILLFSTLLVLMSSQWFMVWFFLEMNTLVMCFLFTSDLTKDKFKLTSVMVYYAVQVFSSLLILFSVMKTEFMFFNSTYILLFLGVMMKMGVWPFHSWYMKMIESLSVFHSSLWLMMTWQKLMPLFIILFSNLLYLNYLILLFSVINFFVSLFYFKNTFNMKSVLGFSSMNSSSWLLVFVFFSLLVWKLFLLFYSLSMVLVMKMSTNHTGSFFPTFLMVLMVFNLAGMPPLPMFWVKMLGLKVLIFLSETKEVAFLFLLSSCYVIFFYLYVVLTEFFLLSVKY